MSREQACRLVVKLHYWTLSTYWPLPETCLWKGNRGLTGFNLLLNHAWFYNAHKIVLIGVTFQRQHFAEKELALFPDVSMGHFLLFTWPSDFLVVNNGAKFHRKNVLVVSCHLPSSVFRTQFETWWKSALHIAPVRRCWIKWRNLVMLQGAGWSHGGFFALPSVWFSEGTWASNSFPRDMKFLWASYCLFSIWREETISEIEEKLETSIWWPLRC